MKATNADMLVHHSNLQRATDARTFATRMSQAAQRSWRIPSQRPQHQLFSILPTQYNVHAIIPSFVTIVISIFYIDTIHI